MRHTALWSCTHIPNIIDLYRKKQLFDLKVKGQGSTKVITVCNTPPYGHAPTYQISLTYLERQQSYGPDKLRWEEAEEEEEEAEEKIRLKQYVSLRSKGRHNKVLWCRLIGFLINTFPFLNKVDWVVNICNVTKIKVCFCPVPQTVVKGKKI